MARILKRPMFNRGGSSNENNGIMTGLVDRTEKNQGGRIGLSNGDSPFSDERTAEDVRLITEAKNKYSPIPKTRLPIGQLGANLMAGRGFRDSALDAYGSFVKADDKTRAATAARKDSAVSASLAQQLKEANVKPKDARTTFMKELEAAGILPGTPEYIEAVKNEIFRESKTTAERNALALNLTPGTKPYNDYIEGATIKTSAAADRIMQGQGVVLGKAARDELVRNSSFVTTIRGNLDTIDDILVKDKDLGGLSGSLKRFGFKAATAAEGIGFPVKELLPKNFENLIFDNDVARLEALETILAPGFARVIFPNQRMTNFLIQDAKNKIQLTGLTGTEEVRARLKEIKSQFDNYLQNNETLLGNQPKIIEGIGNYKVVNGKLVEIVE